MTTTSTYDAETKRASVRSTFTHDLVVNLYGVSFHEYQSVCKTIRLMERQAFDKGRESIVIAAMNAADAGTPINPG